MERRVYVSSSHVIPQIKGASELHEVDRFYPDELKGQYARTKAAASKLVLDYAEKGLNVSLVQPTAIIGPGDRMKRNPMVRSMKMLARLNITVSVTGGYDSVDARDVAKGMVLCEQYGKRGRCYLLSGHYLFITELINRIRAFDGQPPVLAEVPSIAVLAASYPLEWIALSVGMKRSVLTPESIETLRGIGHYSHARAEAELGYQPRDIDESLRDTLQDAAANG